MNGSTMPGKYMPSIHCHSRSNLCTLTQVRIFDQQGKLIQNTPLTEQPQAVLSTAHLPEGRYMIQVVDTHHNTCVKPLVVAH
jgi:hypothetical protein